MELDEQAIEVVKSPQNLSTFAERGFRTVDKSRVLASLTKPGLDPDTALETARHAVEAIGGIVVNADRNAGLGGERTTWRYIYEVWMVPENVVGSSRAA